MEAKVFLSNPCLKLPHLSDIDEKVDRGRDALQEGAVRHVHKTRHKIEYIFGYNKSFNETVLSLRDIPNIRCSGGEKTISVINKHGAHEFKRSDPAKLHRSTTIIWRVEWVGAESVIGISNDEKVLVEEVI